MKTADIEVGKQYVLTYWSGPVKVTVLETRLQRRGRGRHDGVRVRFETASEYGLGIGTETVESAQAIVRPWTEAEDAAMARRADFEARAERVRRALDERGLSEEDRPAGEPVLRVRLVALESLMGFDSEAAS